MTVTISRLYDSYDAASRAVSDLEAAGLAHSNISLVSSNADNWYSGDTRKGTRKSIVTRMALMIAPKAPEPAQASGGDRWDSRSSGWSWHYGYPGYWPSRRRWLACGHSAWSSHWRRCRRHHWCAHSSRPFQRGGGDLRGRCAPWRHSPFGPGAGRRTRSV